GAGAGVGGLSFGGAGGEGATAIGDGMSDGAASSDARPRLAFVGMGAMGGPMAERLLRAGYPLIACDRDPERLAPLVSLGAETAATPREAAARAEVVLTSLPTSEAFVAAVEHPAEGLLAGLRPGATLIDMGTTAPPETR